MSEISFQDPREGATTRYTKTDEMGYMSVTVTGTPEDIARSAIINEEEFEKARKIITEHRLSLAVKRI